VLVDGAQSGGAVRVDLDGLDFYTVSGQKWLCGPDATGGLYLADPDRLRIALPTYLSQQSYEPDGAFVPSDGAKRFDSGAIPLPSLAGLAAAIAAAPEWRYERARETAARCRDLVSGRFDVLTAPGQATLVTFRVGGDGVAVAEALHQRGVLVRGFPGSDCLRASVGYWTSDGDLERLLEELP
jgi:L-cysteine/cystine lyase